MNYRIAGIVVIALLASTHFADARSVKVCSHNSHKCAKVNPKYASKFQCLINWLDAKRYPIYFMGGYRHTKIAGTRRWSKHAFGMAIDVNQTARNRIKKRFPRGVTAAAKRCGLKHGSVWSNPDTGHFEVP